MSKPQKATFCAIDRLRKQSEQFKSASEWAQFMAMYGFGHSCDVRLNIEFVDGRTLYNHNDIGDPEE